MRYAWPALALAVLAGCQSIPSDAPRATARLEPTRNNKASGTVNFYQIGSKVRVVANLSGLTPNREHGFHVHEAGDCSSGDGMSTKGHFIPWPSRTPTTAARPHAGHAGVKHASGNASSRPSRVIRTPATIFVGRADRARRSDD